MGYALKSVMDETLDSLLEQRRAEAQLVCGAGCVADVNGQSHVYVGDRWWVIRAERQGDATC